MTSGPLHVTSRAQLRAYLTTLTGRRYSWGRLALRHNSLALTAPCRFCEGTARPQEGPALFWDGDPICAACAAQIAPELAVYLTALQAAIWRAGGDWRALGRGA